jgi:gamma-glutamyltranspeptidase/glutathione hydrolase
MSLDHVQLARPVLRSRAGVVACGSPAAASAAAEILGDGGTAVDASIAAAAVLAVVQPQACGLGGDAMLLIRDEHTTLAINGNGQAPAELPREIASDGGGTAAVPGFVAALSAAHERFGRLPLSRVFARAVDLARNGFPVGDEVYAALDRHRSRLLRTSAMWPLCDPLTRPASVVSLPRLAEALDAIASNGAPGFYAGDSARAISDAVTADGGTMAIADLQQYEPVVREPVRGEFGGATIEVSPPTSQGVLLILALNELARDFAGGGELDVKAQLRAIQTAFGYRPMIAREDAEALLLAGDGRPDASLQVVGGRPRPYNHTAAITAADGRGQVVSALVSVFDEFGSATFVPELEIHLNSRLLGFDVGPNAPSPGRRPVHTLAPAIVTTPEKVIAVATPGADGQIQTLLQLLVAVLHEAVAINEALHLPRWRIVGDELFVERGFPPLDAAALEDQVSGIRRVAAGDQLFGAVSATLTPIDGGALEAVSDPRRESWAAVA